VKSQIWVRRISLLLGSPVRPPETKGGKMKENRDYFTVNELAEHFGVNPKTIYRRLWAKQIPAYKVGRAWRIARKDIIWLRK
jgi:excisionase family DNA binding protein